MVRSGIHGLKTGALFFYSSCRERGRFIVRGNESLLTGSTTGYDGAWWCSFLFFYSAQGKHMSILVSFDPGLRDAGLAIWRDGELQQALLVRNPEKKERGPFSWMQMAKAVAELPQLPGERVQRLVLEVPQVYSQRFWKGDPADLIELAGVNGAVAALLDPVEHRGLLPRVWKGQTPKHIHNKRVLAALSEEERGRIQECPASLLHNVIDSIGIGLFDLGRMK